MSAVVLDRLSGRWKKAGWFGNEGYLKVAVEKG